MNETRRAELELVNARLRLYLRAERAILSGQSYSVEGLQLTRANLNTVRSEIAELWRRKRELELQLNITKRRSRIRYVIPTDGVYR